MKSELIVDVQPSEITIGLLEDGRLVSLQKEARNIAYAVGDIYLAKVKKLMPGLNAAFVNVGYEKDAFLHYLDLGANFSSYSEFLRQLMGDKKRVPKLSAMKLLPEIDKHGSIGNVLTSGQELLVQIVKEPISSKGPRLTTEISFTGRFLVLTPFCDKISISQKIKSSEEKLRLRRLVEFLKPKNFGVIVRTSAEGKNSAELDAELKALLQSFEDACAKAQRSAAPALVFEEENRAVAMLRDVFSPSFEDIHVNDKEICTHIRNYVALIAPEKKDIVKLYEGDIPILDHFGVTRQIKSSFGKTVSFKSGAYIIIEHTEALHVIDVNSGNRTKADSDQETNALDVNLRAADEIARQLRLRDMGGIIVVDFIDMAKSEHRQQLYEHMREIMANDRARHNILPLSKFGLMQITRQRVRPVLDIHTNEECPSCRGKGEVQPSILFTDMLAEKIEYIVETLGKKDFIVYVHPYVDAYIKKGFFTNLYGKWRRAYGRCFRILPDESLAYLQFRVVDKDRNELNLIDEKDNGKSSASKNADKARKRGGDDEPEQPKPQKSKQNKEQKAKPQPAKEPAEKEQPAAGPQQTAAAPAQPKQPKPKRQPKPKPAKEEILLLPAAEIADAQPEPVEPLPVAVPDIEEKIAEGEGVADTASEAEEQVAQSEAKPRSKRRHHRRKSRQQGDKPAEATSDEIASDETTSDEIASDE